MRSSSGAHYIALDHVRALAAFLVVTWHFTHAEIGYPVPFQDTPLLPFFALFDEGHTGVALFMTLSGYLFAKLLDRRVINYPAFLWNRMLRLVPLLFVVLCIVGAVKVSAGQDLPSFVASLALGIILPTLPNGGWSLTVEFHFYLLLPLLLGMVQKTKWSLVGVLVSAIALRGMLYHEQGDVQFLAYFTLIGRIDQFVLGMLLYELRATVTSRHVPVITALLAFAAFYWYFDHQGGFYLGGRDPALRLVWIVLPTLEGLAYALGIAWYDTSFAHPTGGLSSGLGKLGQFSYCIYLVHFFFVFDAARFVDERIMDLSNFFVAWLWSALFFCLMAPIGYASYYLIEAPFLRLRKPYVIASRPEDAGSG